MSRKRDGREICPYAMVYMVWWPEHGLLKYGRCWRMERIYAYLRGGAQLITITKPMRKDAEEHVLRIARSRYPRPFGRREEAEWLLPGERGRRGGSGYSEVFLVRPDQLREALYEVFDEGTFRYVDDELDAILWRRAHESSPDPTPGLDPAPSDRADDGDGLLGALGGRYADDPIAVVAAQIEACTAADASGPRGDAARARRDGLADDRPAPEGPLGDDHPDQHRPAAGVSDVELLDALTPPPASQRDVQRRMRWGGTRALAAIRAWRDHHAAADSAPRTAPGAPGERPGSAESCGRTARQQIDNRERGRGRERTSEGLRPGSTRSIAASRAFTLRTSPACGSQGRSELAGCAAGRSDVVLSGAPAGSAARGVLPGLRHRPGSGDAACAVAHGTTRGQAAARRAAPAHPRRHRRGAAGARGRLGCRLGPPSRRGSDVARHGVLDAGTGGRDPTGRLLRRRSVLVHHP